MNTEIIGYAALVVSAILSIWLAMRGLRRQIACEQDDEPQEARSLSDELVRRDLSRFLTKQNVIGDADIRNGVVYAPVPPERLEPLATVLINAAGLISNLSNRAADSLYIRTKDGWAMTDLDLDHVIDAARVMQRVAEDRQRSRSLYKGITDDEIWAMARAGLSQAYKDEGDFEQSNDIMHKRLDDTSEIERVVKVLDLLFKVKGAQND